VEALKQWICDACGELIARPQDGSIEWLDSSEKRARAFRIVHCAAASPRKAGPGGNCHFHRNASDRVDVDLSKFLGASGLAQLLAFLDIGQVFDPKCDRLPKIGEMRSFVEIFWRLQLPSYEEARLYYEEAMDNGRFDGADQLAPYLQNTMRDIIEDFAPQGGDE
jgi:hypothetical protein